MLPELGASFGVSAELAAASLTVYLLPFGLLMLVSGTLGERWGRRRTVVCAYLGYAAVSLICALAGVAAVFLAGRALQGAANAFFTPLLLATVAAVTPRERLGRALGWFGSMQAAGQTSAPLLGGLAAELDWRWAFVGVAAVAALLAALGLPAGADRPVHARSGPDPAPPRLRTAWRPEVLRIGLVAAVGWACLGGMSFLVALRVDDEFGLTAAQRGLLLTGFGVAGLLTARLVGSLVDRIGPRRCVLLGAVSGAVLVAVVGLAPWLAAVAAAWALAGVCGQFVLVSVNTLVLTGSPANRAGAVSVVQAMRFLGGAGSPVVITPLYVINHALGFLVPAAVLAVAPGFLLRRPGPRRARSPAGGLGGT